MKLYKSACLGAVALAISFSLFLWFGVMADHAMNKSGIGDLDAWKVLNTRAGSAFWAFVAVWFFLLGFSLFRCSTERLQLFSVCGLAVIASPVAWIVTLLWG